MEFAFDEERERLAGAVTAAIGVQPSTSTGEASPQRFDRAQWDQFSRGPGATAIAGVPEEAIGSAAGVAAILEALGYSAGPDAACLAFGCQLAGVLHPLVRGGSRTDDWFRRLVTGEVFGAPAAPARHGEGVTATRTAGGFVVNGAATVASFGLRPDCLVVAVSTGEDGAGSSVLLLLPADPSPEFEWQPAARVSQAPDSVTLRELEVGEDRMLFVGDSHGDGTAHAQAVFCLGVHAMRIGLLRRLGDVALEAARAASRRMKLTGRPPARFQALTHPIADFIVRSDAARLLVHEGARRLDESERVPMEALLAAFNMETALLSYAADLVGLQRHWRLLEGDNWGRFVDAAAGLGRYTWSPVELTERISASLCERVRPW